MDHGGHVVEVASADFLLVRHEGVALVTCGKFWLLHHVDVVLHAFAAGVGVGELEGLEPVDMDPAQRKKMFFLAQSDQFFLKEGDLGLVEFLLQFNG